MQQVTHTTTILVNATPDETLPLFTAAGECFWIAGWNPAYIYPETGEPQKGMIWKTTRADNIDEIWVTANYDVTQYTASYVKWSPEMSVTQVDIHCTPVNETQTSVQVTYTLTALSNAGMVMLEDFTEDYYNNWILGWEKAIDYYLQHGEPSHIA